MKIAQVAPLYESVPPRLYGGTERVVSYLTEELVRLGHEVTLFASGDSQTSATLECIWPRALRLDGNVRDPSAKRWSSSTRRRSTTPVPSSPIPTSSRRSPAAPAFVWLMKEIW